MQEKPTINDALKRQVSVRWKITLRRLRKFFLTGVLVTAPIAITLYVTYVFIVFMDRQLANILPNNLQPAYGESVFPGSGLIITIVFFIGVGWFATNVLGQMFIQISEYIMGRMPIVRTFYNAIKQVVETLMGSQAKAFREVVLIEYPRKGTWTLGFVTGIPEGEIQGDLNQDLVTVFVPTAPSPVNGFLLFVPRKDMISLKMSVDEGIKMVISCGMIAPAQPPQDIDKAA
ncbi:MAG TPA: DUF502 domain-containing protein [Alphaproteobacteria bacterium]|jgi:uncharacterized membrane protein|nr:DUF502 domain-containing protein [Micavibrio sp.]MBK9561564.1 DUF502 domain-containing protein [Micavibrio sp.]HQX27738.1 DUF502 domain-containing protein [Alphaproteobacteria bacterium]